ncbi:DUF4037 domain-containing protein [Bacillus sp. SD088]|uniref:DUF4037 domain-containing protein n=1 Tax=Bacillus sp. SD088 TaxID=2782012 RepID=UPI001A96FB3E|nr:DUF4037 domain-containing protein [Bacillus sp. SD088]MBO0992025.1 DUF4037 domain-containing protein [Bacillus sp. SD088]
MNTFIQGRTLSSQFYREIIQPLLVNIPHDAVLVGEGSDVLGFDQPISTDHDWGPRVTIFVSKNNEIHSIRNRILANLPEKFLGYSTSIDEDTSNIQVITAKEWLQNNLGIKDIHALSYDDWLSFPQQHLLQFVGGISFADSLGDYKKAKQILSWYPDDVWRWAMASQWYLIWASERLIQRTLEAKDYLGSQLIVQKVVRYIIEMWFLQNKQYKPYDKWLGSAFGKIAGSDFFREKSWEIFSTNDKNKQIELLQQMLVRLGENHNRLRLSKVINPTIVSYEVGINNAVRHYKTFNSSAYKDACTESIEDPTLQKLIFVGTVDQMTNVSDAMINFSDWTKILREGYAKALSKSR